MKRWTPLFALVCLVSSILMAPTHSARAQSDQCFEATGHCLSGRFGQYWQQNGGLAVFGYPIAAQAPEQNRDTGQSYDTQWMERNRFEFHPENQAPYDVLLGRLGDDRLRQKGTDWQTLPKADPGAPHFFQASGHAIAHEPFWRYWSSHGLELGDRNVSERESLALFGLPITEPQMETNSSGDTVLTQWFERARFEDHGAKGVLLGLLGNETRTNGAPPSQDIVAVIAQGFGQTTREVGYGFLLRNLSTLRAAERIDYQITAYNGAGQVVGTDEHFVELLFPGETLGIGGDLFVEAGQRVARIDVHIQPDAFVSLTGIDSNPFRAEGARYVFDQYFPKAIGTVVSSYPRTITNVRVEAILYREDGSIAGGGYTYLDFVPGNSRIGAEMSVSGIARIAKVELYPHLTISSEAR